MTLKFKEGDFIADKRNISNVFQVVRVNFPILGVYMIKHVTTGKVLQRNKDVVERFCLASAAAQVLYGYEAK